MDNQFEVCNKIIPPFQPDLEKKSHYKNYVVASEANTPVSGIISDFYQFITNKHGHHCCASLIPDACTFLAIDLNTYTMRPFLFTCTQSLNQLGLMPNTKYFCVRFYPGLIGNYFHCKSKDFLNKRLYLDESMPRQEYVQLLNKMRISDSFEQRIEIMSNFIVKKHEEIKDFKNIILFVRNQIAKTGGTIVIQTLSKQTGYSEIYLRKLFQNYVGISLKELCELLKFQKSFTLYCANSGTLSDIASLCGYYDHPQMNKAYLRLVNYSPTALKQKLFN